MLPKPRARPLTYGISGAPLLSAGANSICSYSTSFTLAMFWILIYRDAPSFNATFSFALWMIYSFFSSVSCYIVFALDKSRPNPIFLGACFYSLTSGCCSISAPILREGSFGGFSIAESYLFSSCCLDALERSSAKEAGIFFGTSFFTSSNS